jgi:hypothetical protein
MLDTTQIPLRCSGQNKNNRLLSSNFNPVVTYRPKNTRSDATRRVYRASTQVRGALGRLYGLGNGAEFKVCVQLGPGL